MKRYSNQEIKEHLSLNLKDWTFKEDMIRRDFVFGTFVEAFSFMTAVALLAESMDHHPEFRNVYNRVSIASRTHSAGGITHLDFDLASKIDQAFNGIP